MSCLGGTMLLFLCFETAELDILCARTSMFGLVRMIVLERTQVFASHHCSVVFLGARHCKKEKLH